MKIAIILGTRPEIIKLSPIIRECQKRKVNFFILHTAQHYTDCMDSVFFKDLELPQPKYNLGIHSGKQGEQVGKMLIGIEGILEKEKPEVVLVQGDTNSTLAGALASSKMEIKVGHVEAGLRSYDRTMPEEINRIVADHLSDYLFVPTSKTVGILIKEGIERDKIFLTGNTVVDAVFQNLEIAQRKSRILEKFKLQTKDYFLLTLHRPSNVDNKEVFDEILKGLKLIYKEFGQKIVFPIHPRTKKQLDFFQLRLPEGIISIEPISYLDFLCLEKSATLCLTDSGGVQEEACILQTPCVTIRKNTERSESLEVGANILAGTSSVTILFCVKKMLSRRPGWKNPFGDGKSAEKISNIIFKDLNKC